jgi:hypothetical protein
VRSFDGFVHPKVTRMTINGLAGFESLGSPWPAVAHLDFAYGTGEGYALSRLGRRTTLTAQMLPALRTLDLSRNEPIVVGGYERHARNMCSVDFWAAFGEIDRALLAQLVHLRLPSPREVAHVRLLQNRLDGMAALESLEIVRRYPMSPDCDLAHPRAKLAVPARSSWRPADVIPERRALVVDGAPLALRSAANAMEKFYGVMADAGRRAWDDVWQLANTDDEFQITAATLYTAVDHLRRHDPFSWDEVLDKMIAVLHPRAIAEQTITVELDFVDD